MGNKPETLVFQMILAKEPCWISSRVPGSTLRDSFSFPVTFIHEGKEEPPLLTERSPSESTQPSPLRTKAAIPHRVPDALL